MATLTVQKNKLKIGNRYIFTLNHRPDNPIANAILLNIIPETNSAPAQYVFSDYQSGNVTVPGTVTLPENFINMFYVFATKSRKNLPRLPSELLYEISKYGGSKKQRSTKKRH